MASKPMIGVMPLYDETKESIWMLPGYMDGIYEAGGIPVILPFGINAEDLAKIDETIDGYLFTGGHDINPKLYSEENRSCGVTLENRDSLEKLVFEKAYAEDKPILGICRGLQIINVFLGGTLYQDLPTERPTNIHHVMTKPYDGTAHYVDIVKGSKLHDLLGRDTLGVNSLHHQAVKELAPKLAVMAASEDELIEAFEEPAKRYLWAVQWHPEFSYKTDESSRKIFKSFVEACK
ncbi:MAG: gamma-glutamyl-gamma-aminobutyrate hydrolase family protein [Clostridiales bacterium]|nr:gamma-glutamyl-gamma-aminobutyrate hydrolase family protein [Clostridiales bacterium]